MLNLFPKKNDYANKADLNEVIKELNYFRVTTKKDIRLLLKKYRRKILNGEKSKLDHYHKKLFREMYGDKDYNDCVKRQYWLAYPAILREILELEFGNEYEIYTNARDEI